MLLLVPLVAVVARRAYDRCHVTYARATTATSGTSGSAYVICHF